MAIESLFGIVGEGVLEIIKSAAGEAAWDQIKQYIKKTPHAEPMLDLIKDLNECLDSSSRATGISLPMSSDYQWRISWLKGFFNWTRSSPPQATSYLPNFGPIKQFRDAIEDDLLQHGISQENCNNFVANFNKAVCKIRNAAFLDEYYCSDQHFYEELDKHLCSIYKLHDFKMTSYDPPLKDTFIDPSGMLLDANTWDSFAELEGREANDAGQLVNRYFGEKLYRNRLLEYPLLFIGADFGVGKSSFARMFASRLALRFQQRMHGYVPVFISLDQCSGAPERIVDHLANKNMLTGKGPPLFIFLDGLDESGPMTPDYIRQFTNHIEDLTRPRKISLPSGTRFIITSRLILGSMGAIANYIRNTLGGMYLRILPFDAKQIKEWFKKLGINSTYAWASSFDSNQLLKLQMSQSEYSKPLYLWMISKLIQDGHLDPATLEIPLGKAGLYLLFMNLVSRTAKPKDTHAHQIMLQNEEDNEREIQARYLLQHLAAFRNMLPEEQGLTDSILCRHLDACAGTYNKLGGYQFLALSYFGMRKDHFDFTHQSFKEYLIAEYIVSTLLQATAVGTPSTYKVRFCIGEISEATAYFVEMLLKGLVRALQETTIEQTLVPFVKSIAEASLPLKKEILSAGNPRVSRDLLVSAISAATELLVDQKPILVSSTTDGGDQRTSFFGLPVIVLPKSHVNYNIYSERWLMLLIGTVLCKPLTNREFYERILAKDISTIADLVQASRSIPSWAKATLHGIRLANVNLIQVDLDGADLSSSDLRNVAFNQVKARGANLRGINLDGADLAGTDFSGADMEGATLIGTNLSRAILEQVNFTKAVLQGANLSAAKLGFSNFEGGDLTDANLTGAELVGANFEYSNLTRSIFYKAYLLRARFLFSTLNGADFSYSDLSHAYMIACNYWDANLENATTYKTRFSKRKDIYEGAP
jgi:uncharacterized protein YjbI with pentapeptide repeats